MAQAETDITEIMEIMPNKEACKLFGLWSTAELGYAIFSKQLPIGVATPPGENDNIQWKVRVYRQRREVSADARHGYGDTDRGLVK